MILLVEAVELHDDRLHERGDRNSDAHGSVGTSQIRNSSVPKTGMRPQVPPDLLRVVDAVELTSRLT